MSAPFRLKKIKYSKKDDQEDLMLLLRRKKDLYFRINKISKFGNWRLIIKASALGLIGACGYLLLLGSENFYAVQAGFLLLGIACVLTGINFGHDAAHNCLTGNKKTDHLVFELIFGIQGINGYLWKMRHNHSHHPFPNVHGYDTDLGITGVLFLNPEQKRRKIYDYQHLYAPFVYMFFTLAWIFHTDFVLFRKTHLANLHHLRHARSEWVKMILFKVMSLTFFLVIPIVLSNASWQTILVCYIVMHLVLSLCITLVFFISHHVHETHYAEPHEGTLGQTWLEQQIASTSDFHAQSRIANFLFGGFNAHLAHHLFPDVSHIHYPALTRLILTDLEKKGLVYNSLTFFGAVKSHFSLLKSLPKKLHPGYEG